jgi:hypothetical protein
MEVGSPEWIEASLAKLDALERERGAHEAALETARDPLSLREHSQAIERLETEIKTLYAQLEAVAGDDEEEEEEDEGDDDEVKPRNTQGDDELSAPHFARESSPPVAPPAAAPVSVAAASPAASENPFASSSSPSSGGGFDAPASVSFDDEKPQGGGAKWMFLGLVAVAGIGVGGYFAWQNMQAQKAKEQAQPAAAEEIRIDAAKVGADTEAPNAVKGADATISPTANGYPTGSSGGGGGGGGGKKDKDAEKKKKPLTLEQKDDPLG